MNNLISLLQSIPIWEDTAYEYALGAVFFVSTLGILKVAKAILLVRIRSYSAKTTNNIDDLIVDIVSNIKIVFFLTLALFLGSKQLTLPDTLVHIIDIVLYTVIVYEIIQAVDKAIGHLAKEYLLKQETDSREEQVTSMTRVIQIISRMVLWSLGLLFILGNLGIDVTSLIASLGIGGLAVALALQNVLSDIFSSLSIYIDKPFEVGDFIVVGTDMGTVEKIGLKTTRLKSMKGEELVIANKELTTARIQNFKRADHRRETLVFGVTYETQPETLQDIPKIIQQVIDGGHLAQFDRCHFNKFADSALEFEAVYFVDTTDYNTYMNTKQAINMGIMKAFAQANIDFAYPTQTLHIQK